MSEEPATFSADTTRVVLGEACRKVNLDFRDASLMRIGENALYRLDSAPVVVRIARDMRYWDSAAKEVNVARWLTAQGFPGAELFEANGQPLEVSGHPVTFWRFIAGEVAMPEDVAALGDSLRRLHALPKPDDFDLPRVDVLGRVEPRVEQSSVPDADKAMLLDRCNELREEIANLRFPLPETVIHGDAHIKNLMIAGSGRPVLIDFENVAWGQPEWDLSMTATEYITAGWWSAEQYTAFCDAYGFDVTRWEGFKTLRATHEIKMTTWIMQNVDQSPDIAAEYRTRIHTIRTGETGRRWRPF